MSPYSNLDQEKIMKQGIIVFAAAVIMSLVVPLSPLYADIKVSPPVKPWHVTQIATDAPRCDSPQTYSYNVTWKPVYETWNPLRAPSVWTRYVVKTYNCAATSIPICDALCTVRASGCSIKQAASWMRISTILTDKEAPMGSFMEISGIPRPVLTLVGKARQCVN